MATETQVTAAELARKFNCSVAHARGLMKDCMHSYRNDEGQLVVHAETLNEFIESRRVTPRYQRVTPLDPIMMLYTLRDRTAHSVGGFVYFIEGASDGLVKIGFATNVKRRIAEIQRMSPAKLRLIKSIRGTLMLEQALHKRFAACRAHGEWFRREGALKQLLDALAKCKGVH